jgi:signal transduction histidine kinase
LTKTELDQESIEAETVGDPATTEPTSPVLRTHPIDARIDAEQVRLLLELGEASRLTVFGGILVVGLAFWPYAPLWTIGVVAAIQLVAQILFDRVRAGFRADPDAAGNATLWAKRYALVTIVSGSTWGVGSLLWLPGASFTHEIFYVLVLACLAMATAITRASHPLAVIYYIAASCLPTVGMLLWRGDPLAIATVALAGMFFATVAGWTRRVNNSYREAFRLRFENADLVERMARAHAATEQKRRDAEDAETRAKAAMRAKQAFLEILNHEVRAPLDGLSNLAIHLADEPLSEGQAKIARSMGETSQLLRRLFDDMIDLSQMEALSLELRPRRFDPVELAGSVVRMMRHRASGHGLSLELDAAPGIDADVSADADRVRQVLTNLVDNSIKFTDRGGIVVRITPIQTPGGDKIVRFSVTDTGPGLSDESRARLFETFWQGGDARDFRFDGEAGGMGLGLPICDRLVRLMGGQIGVDSAPGQGSTFWFLLPTEPGGAAEYFSSLAADATPPRRQAPEKLIDLGHLYEIEREIGPQRITDHLLSGLERVLTLHRAVERARIGHDEVALAEGARALQAAADSIGLSAISHVAGDIEIALGHGEADAAMRNVPRLQQKITATWRELAKAYPSLAS